MAAQGSPGRRLAHPAQRGVETGGSKITGRRRIMSERASVRE
jgi:hypothetical protein